ncbi:TLC domain-containing protein [Hyaloraphidium curvatum]|nr:TLC domain-containing protein [Hyaloraphidium curvatum]
MARRRESTADSGIVLEDKSGAGLSAPPAALPDPLPRRHANPAIPSDLELLVTAIAVPASYWAAGDAGEGLVGAVAAATAAYRLGLLFLRRWLAGFEFYKSMDPPARLRFQGWSLSFANALVMTALGLRSHLRPHRRTDLLSVSLLAGYLLADLGVLVPHFSQRILDIAHHLLSLALCWGMLFRGVLPSHLAFVMLTEVSTIFLDLARVLPVLGMEKTPAFVLSAAGFAASFLWVRVGWFGALIWRADLGAGDPDWPGLGVLGRTAARALFALQVWWTGEIWKKAAELMGKGGAKKAT